MNDTQIFLVRYSTINLRLALIKKWIKWAKQSDLYKSKSEVFFDGCFKHILTALYGAAQKSVKTDQVVINIVSCIGSNFYH